MKNKIQKYLSGEREGFSLVELIIVIAIMAILIGVIALAVLPYLNKSRENKDKQTLDSVYSAFQTALSEEAVAKATSGTVDADSDALTGTLATLKTAIERNLGITISEAEGKLTSDACSGKKFHFKKSGTLISVTIKGAGQDADGNNFESSNGGTAA